MSYTDLTLLIPCHSLEDFPTEASEKEAAGLLNAWSCIFHPQLLASAGKLPLWFRADSPPEPAPNRLFLIPEKSQSMLPLDFVTQARREGAFVVLEANEREALIRSLLAPFGDEPSKLNPTLVEDFLSFGLMYLLLELLTRHMRHFGQIDEQQLGKYLVEGAKATIEHRDEEARDQLRSAYEMLLEARERFYPVDFYWIDLCLLPTSASGESLREQLKSTAPVSYMACAGDLKEIVTKDPSLIPLFRESFQRSSTCWIGGEYQELPTPLLPLESLIWQLEEGRRTYQEILGGSPKIWARKRFGLGPHLPSILTRQGFESALHLAMDDGFYPDQEYSKIRWDGPNAVSIEAWSRIPLAADSAATFLKLPQRLAESMDHDQIAAVTFARWPELKTPFFSNFIRGTSWAPILGKHLSFGEFFQNTENPYRMASYDLNDYLSPYLVQSIAGREPNPVARYAQHAQRRRRLEGYLWMDAIAQAVYGKPANTAEAFHVERSLETGFFDGEPHAHDPDNDISQFQEVASARFRSLVMKAAPGKSGKLVVNPLSFARRVSVPWPAGLDVPGVPEVVAHQPGRAILCDLPPNGYVWLPCVAGNSSRLKSDQVLVEEVPVRGNQAQLLLKNEFFEAALNPQTGGLGQFKGHARSPNRISTQLAYRFSKEKTINVQGEEKRSAYSVMRATSLETLSTGPTLGEIRSKGELIDPSTDSVLGTFQQTFQIWRGRPYLDFEIQIELSQPWPDESPWTNYVALRLAWNDAGTVLTRPIWGHAHPWRRQRDDRFEACDYLEFSSSGDIRQSLLPRAGAPAGMRTTLLTGGLPFYRKSGERMVDLILMTQGETRFSHRFSLAFDHAYPYQAMLDCFSEPIVIPTEGEIPRAAPSSWLCHIDSPNVQITRILPLLPEPLASDAWGDIEQRSSHQSEPRTSPETPAGIGLRLMETEGKPVRAKLTLFRKIRSGRQRDALGKTITSLFLDGESISVDLTGHELAEIELYW